MDFTLSSPAPTTVFHFRNKFRGELLQSSTSFLISSPVKNYEFGILVHKSRPLKSLDEAGIRNLTRNLIYANAQIKEKFCSAEGQQAQ